MRYVKNFFLILLKQFIYIFFLLITLGGAGICVMHDIYVIILVLSTFILLVAKVKKEKELQSRLLSFWRYSYIPIASFNINAYLEYQEAYLSNNHLLHIGAFLSWFYLILICIYLVQQTKKRQEKLSS